MICMTISQAGVALIKEFESCRLTAYRDGAEIWTIGWGHTHAVKQGDVWTQARADLSLAEDIAEDGENPVNRFVDVSLTQNQFDALVSFTYNEGAGRLASSTLLRLLNSGNPALAAEEFTKWDLVAGKPSAGLMRRRLAEQRLFLSVPSPGSIT